MKLTPEILAAVGAAITEQRRGELGYIQAAVGDAFNLDNLANAIARAETESLIDKRVVAAQRYTRLVPVNTSITGSVGEAIVRGFTDAIGMGRPHSGTGGDIPLAEVSYGEQTLKIKQGAIAYQYSLAEIKAASRHGVALSSDKAAAARLAYERHMWKVAMLGEPETNLYGLLNHNIPEVVVASAPWGADVDAIMADISNAIGIALDDAEQSGDTSMLPDTILLPSSKLRLLNDKRISANSDVSVLDYIRKNNLLTQSGVPDVRIEALPELNTAGQGGTTRAIVYRRDPSALELILPQDLQFVAPQPQHLDIYVPGDYLYAGLWIKSPKSVMYLDGV